MLRCEAVSQRGRRAMHGKLPRYRRRLALHLVCDVVLLKYNEQATEQRFIICRQEFVTHSKQRGAKKGGM